MEERNDLMWFQKSKARDGLYETPSQMANAAYELIAGICDFSQNKPNVLDPCAGSGRLLLPFKKNGYDTIGIEYNELMYEKLKRVLGTKVARCGNAVDYFTGDRLAVGKFHCVVMNPPFGVRLDVGDNYFETGEEVIESQTAFIEMMHMAMPSYGRGVAVVILPTTTWSNAKDAALRNYLFSKFHVYAKITVKNGFKEEYGIDVETDIVLLVKKQLYAYGSGMQPYPPNPYTYDATLETLPSVVKQFLVDYYGSYAKLNISIQDWDKRDVSTIPDFSRLIEYEDDSNGVVITSKGLSGCLVDRALLGFYDDSGIETYNPVVGKPTGITKAYFSVPSLIRNGATKAVEFGTKLGLSISMSDKEREMFDALREKWRYEATPLYQPKAHELLAYYRNELYEARKTYVSSSTGKLLYQKGKKYLFKPTWVRSEEKVSEEDGKDSKGEFVEKTSLDRGFLQINVSSEAGVIEYPESEAELIEELVTVFGLPTVKSVSEAYPHRVEFWAKEIAKRFPFLFDYQAEDLARILTKKNVYIGFEMGAGKCNEKDTLVEVNGTLARISDVYEKYSTTEIADADGGIWTKPTIPLYVNSYNESSRTIESKQVTSLYRERVNTILKKVLLSTGDSITITQAHKLLEARKEWTNEYEVGDYIAVPNKTMAEVGDFDLDVAEFLGWQISEGYEHDKSNDLVITQKSKVQLSKIMEVFLRIKDKYGFTGFEPKIKKSKNCYELHVCSAQYKTMYEGYGIRFGLRSANKYIPDSLMKANNKSVSVFLSSLFEGDGHVNQKKKQIEYTSASWLLVRQIQTLLLRFGINSTIKKKTKMATNGARISRNYYDLIISSDRIDDFRNYIGFRGESTKSNKLKAISCETNSNLQGIYVYDLFNLLIEKSGWKSKFWGFSNLFESTYSGKWNVSKIANPKTVECVIEKIYEFLNPSFQEKLEKASKNLFYRKNIERYKNADRTAILSIALELNRRLASDVTYVKVVSIDDIVYDDYVYDLEVEDNHNYVANNVLAHNTLMAYCYATLRQYQRVLIVCQGSLVDNWCNEAVKFGFKATALKDHDDVDVFVSRFKRKDFKPHQTEFFVIGQEFLSLDGGRVYDEWKCERFDGDGIKIHDETCRKQSCSKGHKYETQVKVCPKCGATYDSGWTGRYCHECKYVAYSYGTFKGITGIRQYPAYKWLKKMFTCVITDESQNYANRSLRGEATRALKAKSRLMLTGTIMKNYVSDVFLNFGWLMGYNNPVFYFSRDEAKEFLDEFGSYEIVSKEYLSEMGDASVRKRKQGRKKLLPSVSNLSRFWRLITPFTVRRLSDDIEELKKIPRERKIVWCDMDLEHMSLYGEIEEWAKKVLNFELSKETVNMGVVSMCLWKLRFAATIPVSDMLIMDEPKYAYPNCKLPSNHVWSKIEELTKIVKDATAKKEKLIVFSGIRDNQAYVCKYLRGIGYKVKYIDAGVQVNDRFDEIKEFSDNGYQVLVTGSNILNRGYTITAANHVVFMDLAYTPEITDQAEYRCIRPGQDKKVMIYYLLTSQTIDSEMFDINNLKREAIQHAINKVAKFATVADLLKQADMRNPEVAVAKKILDAERQKPPVVIELPKESVSQKVAEQEGLRVVCGKGDQMCIEF